MSTEKMRAEFRVWFARNYPKINRGETAQDCLFKMIAASSWEGSRAAIEVEFPEGLTLNELRYGSKPKPNHERLLPRTTCVKAIESLGLKVKP